jgi:TonB family protein
MTPRMLNSGNHGNNSFSTMIFVSLLVHFIVITVVFVSLPSSTRHLTFGPIYSVQLVGPDVILSGNRQSSLMHDIISSNEAASSVILKSGITSKTATPVIKDESNKLNVEKAVSALKQQEKAAPTSAPGIRTPATSAPAAARTSPSDANKLMGEYSNAVWTRIKRFWGMPILPKENIETIVDIKIARDGSIAQVNFEKRSGNVLFDDAALRAVMKAAPFPPLPAAIAENSIEFGIRFHPSELR